MKAVDTNVLARFFVNDPDDPEAAKQRPAAIQAMTNRRWKVLIHRYRVMGWHHRLA